MTAGVDFADEGLLDGLEGEALTGRQELLERLSAEGASLEEMRRAVAEDRLVLLPVERMLTGDVSIDSDELAGLCGLDPGFVVAVRHALGLPATERGETVFRTADVEAFRGLGALRREALIPDEGFIELLGVVGRSLWGISEALLAVADEALGGEKTTERDLALRYEEAARRLGAVAGPFLESAMHAQLREGIRGEKVTSGEISSGRVDDTWTVTVCFVDLVGFTGLGDRLSADESHSLAARLAEIAARVAKPPVRLVKTMGDGAMLVSTEAGPLIEAALELASESEAAAELPPVRIGLSRGEAYARGGDWYGATVNLASRVTEVAEPGTVLVTRSVRDTAPPGYEWSPVGREGLRGITDDVELFELIRGAPRPS